MASCCALRTRARGDHTAHVRNARILPLHGIWRTAAAPPLARLADGCAQRAHMDAPWYMARRFCALPTNDKGADAHRTPTAGPGNMRHCFCAAIGLRTTGGAYATPQLLRHWRAKLAGARNARTWTPHGICCALPTNDGWQIPPEPLLLAQGTCGTASALPPANERRRAGDPGHMPRRSCYATGVPSWWVRATRAHGAPGYMPRRSC